MQEKLQKFSENFNSKIGCLIRLILYIGCTFVCPIIFISMKFSLFKHDDSKLRFTGWGIVCILIIALALFSMLKWCCKNFAYSYVLGVINGLISSVLWLIVLLIVCKSIHAYIERVEFVLGYSILTCAIGCLLNPLPYLAEQSRIKKIQNQINAESK